MTLIDPGFIVDTTLPSERVARGVHLLDERGPENWREILKKHVQVLDVGDPDACPLYFLYGNWRDGATELSLTITGECCGHGFSDPADTQAWKDYLNAL
jgi:hypothetical protein